MRNLHLCLWDGFTGCYDVARMIEERERLSYYTTRRKTMSYVCRVFPVSTGELYSPTDLNAAHEYVKPWL